MQKKSYFKHRYLDMRICVVALLVPAGCGSHAQVSISEGSPEWIVESFFIKKEFPNKERYYAGEMKAYYLDAPNVKSLQPEGIKCEYHLVYQDNNTVNYSVQYTYEDWCGDWYCFIVKEDGIWRLSAVRSLATVGLTELVIEELGNKKSRTEHEEWTLQNAKLTMKCDSMLRQYLNEHRKDFEAIVKTFRENPCLKQVRGEEKQIPQDDCNNIKYNEVADGVRKLHIQNVGRAGNGNIGFLVGGILDNTVGFLFVPKGGEPPAMSEDEYILVEKIDDEWYLYKTT